MSILSRYSYVLLGIVLIVAGSVAAYFFGQYVGLATLLVAALLVVYWVVARRGALTPVNPEKRIRRGVTSGRPVVVHFYSDFSVLSLVQRPFTAKAERECKGACDFIYIEVGHREAAGAMDSQEAGLGDWVLYDAQGKFAGRTRRVTVAKLQALR